MGLDPARCSAHRLLALGVLALLLLRGVLERFAAARLGQDAGLLDLLIETAQRGLERLVVTDTYFCQVAPPKGRRIADPPHEGDLAREGDLFEHPLEGQQEGIRRLTVEVGRGGALQDHEQVPRLKEAELSAWGDKHQVHRGDQVGGEL